MTVSQVVVCSISVRRMPGVFTHCSPPIYSVDHCVNQSSKVVGKMVIRSLGDVKSLGNQNCLGHDSSWPLETVHLGEETLAQ